MPPRARFVRRAPLADRIKALLDPYDFLLWLSEELNDDTLDEWLNDWATPVGVGLNFLFVLARGASQPTDPRGADEVFGDIEDRKGSGWYSGIATFLVYTLTSLSCLNALYTFFRQRHYRLFEQPIEMAPATPSAHRVRVDSSPIASSPLRYLQHFVQSNLASSRAHPDAEREVWELNVWDPKEFNLTLFTLFSPGHVLLYFALLPPAASNPRPSVTVLMAFVFGVVLSLQLTFLKSSFRQQSSDSALIHGEVLNEYDQKYVRPSLRRPVRDVGIQTGGSAQTPSGGKVREVDVYTPTTVVNRGFHVNPNPNYADQYDPDHVGGPSVRQQQAASYTPSSSTRPLGGRAPSSQYGNGWTQHSSAVSGIGGDFSSPIKPHHERLRERSPVKGDGGSMGIYRHAASPLSKSRSHNQLRLGRENGAGSPLKRVSIQGSTLGGYEGTSRRRETRN
ncbi:hypothetical protein K431DRAFT_259789 [Polychaeton citri CBS 116435]|uniref:Nuclear rim protein 1 n=1 Tax=Polychaeton citri CBS 116435 TaxID=1314669 RepID=A0A9P4URR7_9PEZI|nr:hypothetical protein K431DRAFT_259789 [Polychaeton citri CBS 116435]